MAPSEFTGRPWEVTEGPSSEAYGGIADAEQALDACELGEDPGVAIREWPVVAADLVTLEERRGAGDYQGIAQMAPPLLLELHALYVRRPEHREPILCGIIGALFAVMVMTKRLGARGLPLLAGKAAQATTDELDRPEWRGAAMWMRNNVTGSLSRPQHYARAVATADQLTSSLNDETVLQSYGMLHLSAALAAAVQSDRTSAATHLDEAAAVAERMDSDVGNFGRMWFGRTNVAVWRASVGMELGDGPKALEAVSGIGIEAIPDRARLAGFYSEAGRIMLAEPKTRDTGVTTLLKAEQLAPQRIRSDLFVREAVADQLRAARRDAGGRELRGLAWRIGIAPDSGQPRR